jgi:hypothetical protein
MLIPLYRAAFAVLVLVAIVAQATSLAGDGRFNPVNFFSFFTILSNLFGAGVFLALAVRPRAERSVTMNLLRGGSVVYLSVTFIVFALLLSGSDVDLALPWVDTVLHKIFPVVVVADWLIDPPANRLTFRQALLWLSYPAVWIVYTLIRGPIAAWYPYPFLDPAHGGYGSVAIYCIAILVLMTIACAVTVAVGNALGRRRPELAA